MRKEDFMKHEYKRHEKELYGTGAKPALLTLPKQKFILIDGRGDPNGPDFTNRVEALYSLAYPIKMRHKKFCLTHPDKAEGFAYQDYTVFPLEGLWTSESPDITDKEQFIYSIMIRQPDFITDEMIEEARDEARAKKKLPLLDDIYFDSLEDGLSIQMLHSGSFDDEPQSFAEMDAFAAQQGYERIGNKHREIYLTDARKTPAKQRKTILRYTVRRTEG